MTYWSGTLIWPDEAPSASLDDFIATTRKTACINSCKNLSTIQRSDQELRTCWAGTIVWFLVWPVQTLGVSSSNFSARQRKTASRNSCKNLSTNQRSDEELMTYWASTLVWPDERTPASLDDFIATPRKQAFWNSYKNLSTIRSYVSLEPVLFRSPWSFPTRRYWCQVAILVRRQGKQPLETHVKIYARSNGRIKS